MKKGLTATFIACAFAIGLSAQAPAGGAQAPAGGAQKPGAPAGGAQKPGQPSTSTAGKMTITGCVEKAAAGAKAEQAFVLADAKAAGGAGGGAVGTTGATASRYRLEGDDSELSKHVGQQVQITGTIDKAAGGGADPVLKVDAVKMVSAKCN